MSAWEGLGYCARCKKHYTIFPDQTKFQCVDCGSTKVLPLRSDDYGLKQGTRRN